RPYAPHQLIVVQLLFVVPRQQVWHRNELHSPAKALELLVLPERSKLDLVRAADHDHVETNVLGRKRNFTRLHGKLEVPERVERAFEQIRKLDHASTRFDELTMRFEQSDRLQTGRQSRQRSVGGHLSLSCVDAHLRPYGHGPLPVAARNEVALYLN